MKLKQYVSSEETSYTELAAKMGSITSVSLYRYAMGLRKPTMDTIKRIEKVTGGKVSLKDFDKIQPTLRKRKRSAPKRGAALWKEHLRTWHLNGPLECEFLLDDFEESIIPLPLSVAIRELSDRVIHHRDKYYLDGRPSSIQRLIIAANESRSQRGLVEIIYPGCL